MDFGENKHLLKLLKKVNFCGIYFRDIYSSVNEKSNKKSWKEFNQLKYIDQKYCCLNYYDVSVNRYGIKCETLRFWENKG